MPLTIAPALTSDYAVVANLARFYIYDMSEYTGWHFPPDGLFDAADQFANYWGSRACASGRPRGADSHF